MSNIKEYMSGSLNPKDLLDSVKYKLKFMQDNPNYFDPEGIWLYCGAQGSGKTISLVQTLQKICKDYPNAIVCTNLELKCELPNQVIPFVDYSQLISVNNGIEGVIFVFDEIQVFWNCLSSAGIPQEEAAEFCQMRKDRRLVLSSSQVYGRVAKQIREQLRYVIDCRNYFKLIQKNTLLDPTHAPDKGGTVECDIVCTMFWFHSPKLYDSYDTLKKIKKPDRKEK